MQASVCQNKNFLQFPRPQTVVVWGRDYSYTRSCVDEEVYIHVALYRYFRPVDALPGPSGSLSASASPTAVKDESFFLQKVTYTGLETHACTCSRCSALLKCSQVLFECSTEVNDVVNVG